MAINLRMWSSISPSLYNLNNTLQPQGQRVIPSRINVSYADSWQTKNCNLYIQSSTHGQKAGFISQPRFHLENITLTNNTVHESLLHLSDLALERINLLPAIQRPTVIQPQATDNISLRLLNTLIQLGQLSPPIEPAAQLVDLACH